MSGVRNVLADHVRSILLVAGVGLTALGAVGPGSIGPVSVLGVVTILSAVFLASPLEELLRTEAETGTDPVEELRDRYVAGDIDQEEFERRMDDLFADDRGGGRAARAGESTSDASESSLERHPE